MLCLKILNEKIVEVIDSSECPDGFVAVPDSFVFVSDDVRYYDNHWAPKPEDTLVQEGIIPPERKVYSTTTGEPKTIREFDIPEGFTLKEPGGGQVWDGGEWVTPEPVIVVPQSITMRQARLCLHRHGMLASVQPAIDALEEPDRTAAQIEWDYSSAVERESGFVLMIAQSLGITDEQLDALFIEAATL